MVKPTNPKTADLVESETQIYLNCEQQMMKRIDHLFPGAGCSGGIGDDLNRNF